MSIFNDVPLGMNVVKTPLIYSVWVEGDNGGTSNPIPPDAILAQDLQPILAQDGDFILQES